MAIIIGLIPLVSYAGAPPPAKDFAARLSSGKLIASFTEGDPGHTAGYLLIKKPGMSKETPFIADHVDYSEDNKLNIINGWTIVGNSGNGQVVLEQGDFTYLLYMRNSSFEYSAPKRLIVTNQNSTISTRLNVDLLVFLNGITINSDLTIERGGALVWLGGDLNNNSTVNLSGLFTVPPGRVFENGLSAMQVWEGGNLRIEGSYNLIDRPNSKLIANAKGTITVAPSGELYVQKHGNLQVKKDSYFNVDGTLKVTDEPHMEFSIADDAITTFGPAGLFDLWKNMSIPKATWLDGATLAYHHDLAPVGGLAQSFSNFIWDGVGQGYITLTCDLKNIRGNLTLLTTNNKELRMGSCGDMNIGGNLIIESKSALISPKKLIVNGSLINQGKLSVSDQITVGSITNSAGASLYLPKVTVATGDINNQGVIEPASSGNFEALTLDGYMSNASGAKAYLPKNTIVRGDLLNAGNLIVNENLNLEGSLQNSDGAAFSSTQGWTKINFKNDTKLNRSSVLSLPVGMPAASSAWMVLVKSGRKITLGSDIELGSNSAYKGFVTVEGNASLFTSAYAIRNASGATGTSFDLRDAATLGIGHAEGITTGLATTGAIQTTTRTFSGKAFYIYNGSATQTAGNGLPAKLEGSLTIDNPTSVKLSQSTEVTKLLEIKRGNLNLNNLSLTVLWDFVISPFATLTGSSTSDLIINNDDYRNITLPGVELRTLFIRVKDEIKLAGDIKVHGSLRMDKGVLNTVAKKVTLMPTATLTEDEEVAEKGFVLGRVETEHNASQTNKWYTFSNIGLDLYFKSKAAGLTKLVRLTGNTSETSKEIVVNRAFLISTAADGGLNATMVFRYMEHELKALLVQYAGAMKLLQSTDGGKSYKKLLKSIANTSAQTITLDGIDWFSTSTSSTSGMQVAQSQGNPDLLPRQSIEPVAPSAGMKASATAAFSATGTQAAVMAYNSTWSAGDPNGVLPVELTSFAVKSNALGQAILTWATASEENNNYFEVQRSEDGTAWITLGQVKGAGNSNSSRTYTYIDEAAAGVAAPYAYYRLKQVDFDGSFDYSKVVALQQDQLPAQISQIYYDANSCMLEINYVGLQDTLPMQVALVDISGRVLHNSSYQLPTTSGALSIFVGTLPKGIFVAKATNGEVALAKKLMH